MPNLELHFSHSYDKAGPLFHRYHPSESDGAILIPIDRPAGTLRIFFRQRGYVTGEGLAVHDEAKNDLTPEAINLTAVVNVGWLVGRFTCDVDSALIEELALKRYGAPRGLAYAKQMLHAVVNPHFVRAVNSIRQLTGQYWLTALSEWDRRDETLGTYCQHLQMQWRAGQNAFAKFYPDKAKFTLPDDGPANPYAVLPNKTKWDSIVSSIQEGYTPSLLGMVLLRAHQLRQEGELRLAYVEAVAAAEIALDEALRATVGETRSIKEAAQSVLALTFKAKLSLFSRLRNFADPDIELALRAYDIRCDLVHEGLSRDGEETAPLDALLGIVHLLMPDPRPDLSVKPNSNEGRQSSEEWERLPGRRVRGAVSMSSIPPGYLPWGFDETQIGESATTSEILMSVSRWEMQQGQ